MFATNTIGESTMGDEALHQRIAEKAYELYEKRVSPTVRIWTIGSKLND